MLDVKAETHPIAPGEPLPQAEYRTANPDYFQASGIPLLKGREFSPTDGATSPRVVILNKTLADLFVPGQGSDRPAHGVDGRRAASSSASRAIGARWSASSATRRTAVSTRSRCR